MNTIAKKLKPVKKTKATKSVSQDSEKAAFLYTSRINASKAFSKHL